jgi:hypothetical protein
MNTTVRPAFSWGQLTRRFAAIFGGANRAHLHRAFHVDHRRAW